MAKQTVKALVNTEKMKGQTSGISTTAFQTSDYSRKQLTIVETNKEPFDGATTNLDLVLFNKVEQTNAALYRVKEEYQNRIDVQNCRSDLFWRVVGFQTVDSGTPGSGQYQNQWIIEATKLSPRYEAQPNITGSEDTEGGGSPGLPEGPPGSGGGGEDSPTGPTGFTTNAVMWFTGGIPGVGTDPQNNIGITTIPMDSTGDGKLVSDGTIFDAYLEPDNLHGLKLYEEPYSRDVLDSFVASGVGTIGIATNKLTLLTSTPIEDIGITTGNVVTSRLGVFPSNSNTVVGIATTLKDLSVYPFTNESEENDDSLKVCPLIHLQFNTIGEAEAPDKDGNFTNFEFSIDPDDININRLAVDISDNPYVLQTISIMTIDKVGMGTGIKYVNTGIGSNTQQWNKFLNGLPDPEAAKNGQIVIVREPGVGPGKVYYPVGFTQKPIVPGGGDAVEGQQVIVNNLNISANFYSNLTGCDNSSLNSAKQDADKLEDKLANDDDNFNEYLTYTNAVKNKRNDLNLQSWAYRMQIGEANKVKFFNDNWIDSLNLEDDPQTPGSLSKKTYDIMNRGSGTPTTEEDDD